VGESEQKERTMSALEDMFKGGNIVTGLAMGIGAAVVAPVIIPVLRPVAKSLLKAGLIAYDQGRVALAEFNEQTSDLVAEARSELAEAGHSAKEAAEEAAEGAH
jgi:Protein of unknown function (DUF5132)